jgi:hypothetical protein
MADDEAAKERKQRDRERDEARFLAVLQTRDMVCNNSVQGGDCYGETYCNDFSCGDAHKLHNCACGIEFCGCCLFHQKKYVTCLICHTDPVAREGAPSMVEYWEDSSDDE